MSDPSSPKPRSLWDIMKRVGATTSTSETVVTNAGDDDRPSSTPKGLWKVMGLGEPGPSPVAEAPPRSNAVKDPSHADIEPAKSRDLRQSPTDDSDDDEFADADARAPAAPAGAMRSRGSVVANSGRRGGTATMPLSSQPGVQASTALPSMYEEWKERRQGTSLKMVWLTLAVGLCGLLASSLSYFESFWFRVPATALGLVALVLGLVVLSGTGRARHERNLTWITAAGMTCGLLGMFMGPLIFSGWGIRDRQEAAIAESRYHLEQIGGAIGAHHTAKGRFPAGGTFIRRNNGIEQGMHGWMTELLPYIGKADLYSMVNFQKPYDDLANFAVFSQDVPTFFASGGDRKKIGRGLAVSHFAAVGGSVKGENGRIIDLGIFGPDSDLRRTQVTDGLSQTLAVGEVGYGYPAWGEPENWRQVGKGLNREPVGFGNSQGNGALFLLADGSVKYFSNDTDPEILRRLSTRNGNDGPESE